MKEKEIFGIIPFVLLLALLLPVAAQADPGNQYCITPPFITAGIKPNLLLMIDNSASMYDLAYQDTTNMYCANAPGTACTANSQCATAGQAYCVGSYATTAATTTKAACNTDADCQKILSGDTCVLTGAKAGRNLCTAATVTTPSTASPIACSANSQCSASGGTCPAGTTCTWTANDTCNNTCSASRQCYDTTYAPYTSTSSYYGYFDATATYSYDFTNNKFTSGATMPSTCTYSAGTPTYFCVNTTGTGAAETVVTGSTGFVVSGNFLNWLSASKFDHEKKMLTGGKFDPTASLLAAESRGCGGREFLKAVPGVNLTFAIRGGTPGGIGTTQSLATEYGQSYIDIYAGVYNAAACLSAMNDWVNVASGTPPNLGTFQNDTKSCVGAGTSTLNPTSMWNHALHNCYQGMTGGASGYSTNLGPLEGECQAVYSTFLPSQITDPNSAYAVCSSVLTYTLNGVTYTGYLGACWNGTNFNGPCKDSLGNPQPTDLTQMQNYCKVNVTTNPATDPSSTAVTSSVATASIPGFVMAQGLTNLTRVATLTVKAGQSTPPTGLIDKYNDRVRFGVMTFQNNGSGSECGSSTLPCAKACYSASTGYSTRICYASTDCPTGQTCQPLPKTDGGQIISYVGAGSCSVTTTTTCNVDSDCASLTPSGQYCQSSTGNHSSGLVQAVDAIQATTWTPFAEAYYNAMGYFARSNDYSVTPPTSRNFNFSTLGPNTATSYDTSKNPSQFKCQLNNILLITDGMSTADMHTDSEALASLYASMVPYTIGGTKYNPGDASYDPTNVHGATSSCPSYSGSRSISALAWLAKNRNIKTLATSGTASTDTPQASSESISTYVVYSGPQTSSQSGLCDPKTLMMNTAANGGTTLFSATDPATLYSQLDTAMSSVAAKAASGTAASILSNSEGSGANILQAVFYPKKNFENQTSASWVGEMQNLWYYVDPYINNSTIREDTDGDLTLNLINDYIARFAFDNSSNRTMVQLYQDTNGDGIADVAVGGLIDPDYVKSLWRAGKLLWSRNISTSPRTIKTTITGTSLVDFSSATFPGGLVASNAATLAPYLNVPDAATAATLINWVHGQDQTGYRGRTVDIKNMSGTGYTTGVWRLGDIISSTPRVQSSVRLNTYNLSPPGGYSDTTYDAYINSSSYLNRGMVYVGANDGMLHAFKLGLLSVKSTGMQKASLSGTNLGSEQWAFIPRNYLPYLQYLSDPAYQHLYGIDGRTLLLDASIGNDGSSANYWDQTKTQNSWRTVVIGSMGLGGASQGSCADPLTNKCVATPIKDPADATKSLGYSSYFALDVTNPDSPSLLWEFSNDLLGYSTTGPALVRVGDRAKNGRWFAVFGSGPFGRIDTGTHQFKGESTQYLRLFVVDLATGALVRTIQTTITNAFASSMIGGAIDADRRAGPSVSGNYQDDAVYVGYVKQATSGTWTDGGVLRLMTKESLDPANWAWSTVIDGIGPVTTAIAKVQDTRSLSQNLWLYFGTGRYYYRDSTSLDDYNGNRALFGIKEPCYNTVSRPGNVLDGSCTSSVTASALFASAGTTTSIGSAPGWQIPLEASTTSLGAERVVTDTLALTNGTVFFTSFKPTMDVCGYGGNSYLWGVKYDTGGAADAKALQGKALIQLSTGEFKEVDLSSAFTDQGNRRMLTPMTGKPPSDAPPIISNSQNRPLKKILHIKER